MTTGRIFFLISSSETAAESMLYKFPVDADGVVRVYTSWASVITACQTSTDADVIVVSPLFTTAPTVAQIEALKAANTSVIRAGNVLPDGSYLATKAAFAVNTATTTDLFNVTGRVEILDIIGEIATTLGAATTGAKFIAVPTVGSSTDLCVTTNIASLATGGTLTITGTLANALNSTTQGAVIRQATPLQVKAGTLQLNITQTTTGNVRTMVRYKPLEPGALIFPA